MEGRTLIREAQNGEESRAKDSREEFRIIGNKINPSIYECLLADGDAQKGKFSVDISGLYL